MNFTAPAEDVVARLAPDSGPLVVTGPAGGPIEVTSPPEGTAPAVRVIIEPAPGSSTGPAVVATSSSGQPFPQGDEMAQVSTTTVGTDQTVVAAPGPGLSILVTSMFAQAVAAPGQLVTLGVDWTIGGTTTNPGAYVLTADATAVASGGNNVTTSFEYFVPPQGWLLDPATPITMDTSGSTPGVQQATVTVIYNIVSFMAPTTPQIQTSIYTTTQTGTAPTWATFADVLALGGGAGGGGAGSAALTNPVANQLGASAGTSGAVAEMVVPVVAAQTFTVTVGAGGAAGTGGAVSTGDTGNPGTSGGLGGVSSVSGAAFGTASVNTGQARQGLRSLGNSITQQGCYNESLAGITMSNPAPPGVPVNNVNNGMGATGFGAGGSGTTSLATFGGRGFGLMPNGAPGGAPANTTNGGGAATTATQYLLTGAPGTSVPGLASAGLAPTATGVSAVPAPTPGQGGAGGGGGAPGGAGGNGAQGAAGLVIITWRAS